ncbi:MAG TPA: hypothetical protein VLJ21_00815, partial [Candidatus Binatia bacterium]|nr:hypothetical protein [Candidatus Binatia bacterium]
MLNLRKELEQLPDTAVVLLLLNVRQYFEGIVEALRVLVEEENRSGVYITVNKPYGTLRELLRERDVDTSKLYFIDAISQTVTQPKLVNPKVTYLPNPQSLTDISLAFGTAAESLTGKKFLFLDSLSTLLIYNETGSVAKFAHFLTLKMRAMGMKGVLVTLRHMLD